MEPSRGRSGIGLLAFAVLASVMAVCVAAVAFAVGQQLAVAQEAFGRLP